MLKGLRTAVITSVATLMWVASSAGAMAGVIDWAFSYTVGGDAASGIITTSDSPNSLFAPLTAYDIVAISGNRNGNPIALSTDPGAHTPGGVISLDGLWQFNNELYATDPFFDLWGLLYVSNGIEYNVFVDGGTYQDGYWTPQTGYVIRPIDANGSIERVPEGQTLWLVVPGCLSLLGFVFMRARTLA